MFIHKHRSEFRIAKMCQVLNVSRSGYYAYIKRPESAQSKRRTELLTTIRTIYIENERIYGAPRIAESLPPEHKACIGTVAKLMRQAGIRSKTAKKFKATTNSNHSLPVAENLLNRDFTAERRNQKWVSDITYIWTQEGWLYLAGILDLYDRAIVGWAMDSKVKTDLVIRALNQAIGRTKPQNGLLLHSDRGIQYASKDYQKLLTKHGIICSMSRKGYCYDNAPMESFWGKLKSEWLNDKVFKTREEAKKAVFEYIELFHNRRRLHSSNGYIPPVRVTNVA